MANYYGVGRTNAFTVKDIDAFRTAMDSFDLSIRASDQAAPNRVCLFSEAEGGGWERYDEDEDAFVNVVDMIAEHLADGECAIFQHVGFEKLRYLTGYAVAVHSTGEHIEVDIDSIYKLARDRFGLTEVSTAQYGG